MEDRIQGTRRRARPEVASEGSCGAEAPEGSGLLELARSWGDVARAAYDDCEKGADAEAELLRRRNQSGE